MKRLLLSLPKLYSLFHFQIANEKSQSKQRNNRSSKASNSPLLSKKQMKRLLLSLPKLYSLFHFQIANEKSQYLNCNFNLYIILDLSQLNVNFPFFMPRMKKMPSAISIDATKNNTDVEKSKNKKGTKQQNNNNTSGVSRTKLRGKKFCTLMWSPWLWYILHIIFFSNCHNLIFGICTKHSNKATKQQLVQGVQFSTFVKETNEKITTLAT